MNGIGSLRKSKNMQVQPKRRQMLLTPPLTPLMLFTTVYSLVNPDAFAEIKKVGI